MLPANFQSATRRRVMKLKTLFLLIFSVFLFKTNLFSQTPETPQTQTSVPCNKELEEKNSALARRFYEQVWFSDNPAAVDELFAPEYVAHDIGDRKGVTELANEQKKIAAFFWENGAMTGNIDYQIAECDLVATRWQWKYQPKTWWMKMLGGRNQIPIINVFRFKDGKIVEIWNHRHDIDTAQGNFLFVNGLLIGLIPSLILLVVSFLLWRKLRKR